MSALAAYWPWPDLQLAWPLALLALPLPILMYAWKRRADPGAALRVPYAAAELEALAGGGRVGVSWLRSGLLWLGWLVGWIRYLAAPDGGDSGLDRGVAVGHR